jgi:hypothetical protein
VPITLNNKIRLQTIYVLQFLLYFKCSKLDVSIMCLEEQTLNFWRLTTPVWVVLQPLISRRCILYIYSSNTRTEYFKLAAHSPFFSLQNAVYFIMLLFLVPVLFTFQIQDVLNLKENSGAEGLIANLCIYSTYLITYIINYFHLQKKFRWRIRVCV